MDCGTAGPEQRDGERAGVNSAERGGANPLRISLHSIDCRGPHRRRARAVESRKVLARTNGWIDPLRRVMHCEALQVFTKGVSGAEGRRLRRGPLGLGMPLGVATMAYADSKGCHTAEILAINDYGVLCAERQPGPGTSGLLQECAAARHCAAGKGSRRFARHAPNRSAKRSLHRTRLCCSDYQHRRLVRYYSFFGFRKVKEVTGDRLADLPDQLLWGGLGTRMDADVTELHCRWSRALRAPLASESEMRGAKPEGAVEK